MKWRTLTLVLCVQVAGAFAADKPIASKVTCSLNYSKPAPCESKTSVSADGVSKTEFVFNNRKVVFSGQSQTGWWSGTLDGQPAMGRELNRGHVIYSTVDLKTTFEWWSEGMEHGTY